MGLRIHFTSVISENDAKLTAEIQQLETQRNNLTEQIQNMETHWNKVSQCKACQNDWLLSGSNCYAYNDAEPPHQKTWEEAQENCRGKGSDLVVVHNEEEKNALNDYSRGGSVTVGYWFGLRAEGGRWKWIDGSNLTVR
uniref:C-type lectin domain-containing protein n=1 Tax=Sander lucioperca TaxID=283035 RepID=A0A8C9ZC60_SANLU